MPDNTHTEGLVPQEDDYDLLTHFEATRRLTDEIDTERSRSQDGSDPAARQRVADLEAAARRHRGFRPAEQPSFFSADGNIRTISTAG